MAKDLIQIANRHMKKRYAIVHNSISYQRNTGQNHFTPTGVAVILKRP